ncbi:MAG: hypothetical protein SX243_01310 [Acidobacteriota bacterium]|jgi:hypothetical protein|nr:hypothetical protein [Acidobacteriota bacterium]
MSNGFTFYEGTSSESAEVARVTVRKGGILVLTAAAVAMLGDGVERVQVGFNPETGAIGLRAADEGARGAYGLRQQKGSLSRLVDGKRVFAHHRLTADKARRYEAQDFGDGVVGIVLEPPAANGAGDPPARGAKAKTKKR